MLEDDALDEDATFTVAVGRVGEPLAADPTATGTIYDDELEPSLSWPTRPRAMRRTGDAVGGERPGGDGGLGDVGHPTRTRRTARCIPRATTRRVETLEDATVEGDETFTDAVEPDEDFGHAGDGDDDTAGWSLLPDRLGDEDKGVNFAGAADGCGWR